MEFDDIRHDDFTAPQSTSASKDREFVNTALPADHPIVQGFHEMARENLRGRTTGSTMPESQQVTNDMIPKALAADDPIVQLFHEGARENLRGRTILPAVVDSQNVTNDMLPVQIFQKGALENLHGREDKSPFQNFGSERTALGSEESTNIDPQTLSIDQIRESLNADTSEVRGVSSSIYGSGEAFDIGQPVEGGNATTVTMYDSVMDLKEKRAVKKSAPSVVVADGTWQATMYKGVYLNIADYSVVVDRVEEVVTVEDGMRFTGTTGKKEAMLEVHSNGNIIFSTEQSECADQIPDAKAEVKRLEGEKLSRKELSEGLQEAVKEYRQSNT